MIFRAAPLCPFVVLPLAAVAYGVPPEEDDDEDHEAAPPLQYKVRTEIDFHAVDISGELLRPLGALAPEPAGLGATVGGAQDIATFRALVAEGAVPTGEALTPEGLFSEHDLPLDGGSCERLLCVTGAAARADLLVQDDVRWLAQVGFASGVDAASFARPPLNLVLVADTSGSMDGEPIEVLRGALHAVVDRLDARDQLSLVAFERVARTVVAPVAVAERADLHGVVDGLVAGGGTNLEGGLSMGFDVARRSRRAFDGVTRVLVLTDEQPNIGATHPGAFMSMARAASAEGIGLTTVGVGMDLDVATAAAVASVRGGNAISAADPRQVRERLVEDFDLLMVELAYDLDLRIHPARGLTIAGVYGVPGEGVAWIDGGGVRLTVETVFASRERGGLYLGFSEGEGSFDGDEVAMARLSYTARDGPAAPRDVPLRVVEPEPLGLSRGAALVDAATATRTAVDRYHEGALDDAVSTLDRLATRLARSGDEDLGTERDLVRDLREAMRGGPPVARRDPVTGLPPP